LGGEVSDCELEAKVHRIGTIIGFFARLRRDIAMARSRARNPWLALAFDSARLSAAAQHVILLRLTKLGCGAHDSQAEIKRMINEKFAAFADAHRALGAALTKGIKHHVAAKRALNIYRKAVASNIRRLRRDRAL
jgi:hypothetical protein